MRSQLYRPVFDHSHFGVDVPLFPMSLRQMLPEASFITMSEALPSRQTIQELRLCFSVPNTTNTSGATRASLSFMW